MGAAGIGLALVRRRFSIASLVAAVHWALVNTLLGGVMKAAAVQLLLSCGRARLAGGGKQREHLGGVGLEEMRGGAAATVGEGVGTH